MPLKMQPLKEIIFCSTECLLLNTTLKKIGSSNKKHLQKEVNKIFQLEGITYTKRNGFHNGTITRTRLASQKFLFYMRNSAYRLRIVENATMLWSYFKHFWILPGVRSCRILIGLRKWVLMRLPIIFLDQDNWRKVVLRFNWSLKEAVAKVFLTIWNIFLRENKLTLIPGFLVRNSLLFFFFSFLRNQNQESIFYQLGGLVTRDISLSCV